MGNSDGAPPFRITIEASTIVAVGDLDLAAAEDLKAAASSLSGGGRVVFDFAGVTFIDSSCLAVLARLAASGVVTVLRHVPPVVSTPLEVVGLRAHVLVED